MAVRWEVANEVVPSTGQEPALKAHGFHRLGVIRARFDDPDPAFATGVLREVWVDDDGTALTLAAGAHSGDADVHTIFVDGTIIRTFGFTHPGTGTGIASGALEHADLIDEVIVGRGLGEVLARHRSRAEEIASDTACWPISTLAQQVQLNNRVEQIRETQSSAVAAALVGLVGAELVAATLLAVAFLTDTIEPVTVTELLFVLVAIGGIVAAIVVSQRVALPWGPQRIEPAKWADG